MGVSKIVFVKLEHKKEKFAFFLQNFQNCNDKQKMCEQVWI